MERASKSHHALHWLGLLLGPLAGGVCLWALPTMFEVVDTASGIGTTAEFSWAGRATLAVMVWMGIWWLTEAIHISATALLPIVIFPLLGVRTIDEACFPYANPLIFLYLGGFVIALSMERWGLGKRIALLTLRLVGTSGSGMVVGFMLVTAVLSAFVSNTATTAMMLPIALSVVALLRRNESAVPENSVGDGPRDADNRVANNSDRDSDDAGLDDTTIDRFATCLLLSIAYSASVGGIMTVIGTPTNAFLVGFLRKRIAEPYRIDFSFVGWLPIGMALTVTFLPIMYVVLTKFVFPIGKLSIAGGQQLIRNELHSLGKVGSGERNTLCVFLLTVAAWLLRPVLAKLQLPWGDTTSMPLANLTDSGIAMTGALLLFLIPVDWRRREFTMDWKTAERMPWGILILFGGGLTLAAAVQANGVAEFIGSQAAVFGTLPPIVLVLVVVTAVVFLTELTSNAATTASLVPVLAALAPGLGVHPYLLCIPATIAASCAFMLPVATPPNAIVFGSGVITVPQMIRAGVVLNLVAVFLVTLLAWLVVKPWLGI